MKKTYLILFLLVFVNYSKSIAQNLDSFFQQADEFFLKNVIDDKVNYKAIKEQPEQVNKLTEFIATANVNSNTLEEQKAFYINSYNILVIKSVVDLYPISQPLDIAGFFDAHTHKIGGKKTSLNNLEKKYLLQKFKDARLHFVLVCAAVSCPPIANFAYRPNQVEKQLDDRTKLALNDSLFLQFDKHSGKAKLSKIFDWYASDFKPNVKAFVNQYKNEGLAKETKLSYYPYNWRLNDYIPKGTIPLTKEASSNFIRIIAVATMPKKTFEINLWNGLYTSNYTYNQSRSSYFTGFFQFTYGVTGSFDIGLDFLLKSNRTNDVLESSPFRVFEFKRGSELVRSSDSLYAYSDFGLTHVGPRIRWAPFKKISLTFEQGLYFPIPSIAPNINFDKAFYWVTQFYFNHEFSSKFGAFVALTFWQPIVPQEQFKFNAPYLKFFFSWYASKRFTLYATTTTLVEWGLGAKLLITPQFEVQLLYTYYVPIPVLSDIYISGASNVMTFNLGLRYRISFASKKH